MKHQRGAEFYCGWIHDLPTLDSREKFYKFSLQINHRQMISVCVEKTLCERLRLTSLLDSPLRAYVIRVVGHAKTTKKDEWLDVEQITVYRWMQQSTKLPVPAHQPS